MALRVLCIDDDARLYELLASFLGPNGIVLEHGRVVEDAPVSKLLTAPASSVTQGLLRDATATLWRPGGAA